MVSIFQNFFDFFAYLLLLQLIYSIFLLFILFGLFIGYRGGAVGLDVLPERFTDAKIRDQLDVETNVPGKSLLFIANSTLIINLLNSLCLISHFYFISLKDFT